MSFLPNSPVVLRFWNYSKVFGCRLSFHAEHFGVFVFHFLHLRLPPPVHVAVRQQDALLLAILVQLETHREPAVLSSELAVRDRHQQSVLYLYVHIKQPETQSESVSPMDYLLSSELVVRDRHQQSVLYIYVHIKQPETQSELVSPMDYLLSSELAVRDRHQQSVLYLYVHIKQPETQSESVSPMDYLLSSELAIYVTDTSRVSCTSTSISNNLKHKVSR